MTTFALVFVEISDRGASGVAVDSLADEFAHEAHIADCLTLLLYIELRIETVVEKALAFAALDCCTYVLVRKAFAR